MSNTLPVSEVFLTLSGEGNTVGVPTTYVRVFGCNLSCSFCDTKYSITKIDDTIQKEPLESIVNDILEKGCSHVSFTGGEPMLYQEQILTIMELLKLTDDEFHFSFETNGLVYPRINYPFKVAYNVSPKFHALDDKYINSIVRWDESDKDLIFKFVYEGEKTIDDIENLEKQIGGFHKPIYLMPEGRTLDIEKYKECCNVCIDKKWNFSPRLQCIVWSDARGK